MYTRAAKLRAASALRDLANHRKAQYAIVREAEKRL
jgi:hypothetical protein